MYYDSVPMQNHPLHQGLISKSRFQDIPQLFDHEDQVGTMVIPV